MWTYRAKVVRVIDGDTVDVDIDLGFGIWQKNERVRIMGIDTPESRTRDKDEKVRGKMAASYLKEAIKKGKKVIIQTKLKDSKGKFGRVLGNVIVDGININQSMVDNHLAVAYFGQSKNDIEAEHLINRDKLIELGKFTPVT